MNSMELKKLLAAGENLAVEFKSDRGPLPDTDLLDTVVCLANAGGGHLLLGVEDNGAVTGLHANHRRSRPELLAAFIANRTIPPQTVTVTFQAVENDPAHTLAIVQVPASPQPVATSDGRLLIRYLDSRGEPGCRPLYPHELMAWRADRGQADYTAQVIEEATWDTLDPLEFVRLRRLIAENRGDAALLDLSNEEIAGALGVVQVIEGVAKPTVAGLLLFGKEAILRRHVPAHEVAFQVLEGTDVAANEFRRWPLLRILEWVIQAIDVRNQEQELMVNWFRVGVPRYDRRGIREAINNALIHRDYTQLGAVHVQLHIQPPDEHALITNPGGFVANVTSQNVLVAAPRPRNPLLADAFKRTGLVERTGRGVGVIYQGQLRNGRPAPDYSRSTASTVTVTLNSRAAALEFIRLTIQGNRQLGRELTVSELLALWQVWQEQRTDARTLAPILQRPMETAASVLADLAAADLIQSEGEGYRLSSDLRASLANTTEQAAFDPEAVILAYVREQGQITRREVTERTGLNNRRARYQLQKLTEQGDLELVGSGRGAYYRLPKSGNEQ